MHKENPSNQNQDKEHQRTEVPKNIQVDAFQVQYPIEKIVKGSLSKLTKAPNHGSTTGAVKSSPTKG